MSLEHVLIVNVDNISMEEVNKIFPADIEDVMAIRLMLVDLHAAGAQQLRDVIIAEESLCYFEASTSPESSLNVVNANDCVSYHCMLLAKHRCCELVDGKDFTRADSCLINFDTLAKEELV